MAPGGEQKNDGSRKIFSTSPAGRRGWAGRGLIRLYRYTLSPFVGYECRHLPTCSHYAEEAIERYDFGPAAG